MIIYKYVKKSTACDVKSHTFRHSPPLPHFLIITYDQIQPLYMIKLALYIR